MKHVSRKIAHRYAAVNQVAALRSAEQRPRFRPYLFPAPLAIGISATRELWSAIPSAVMHRLLPVEDRCQVFFHRRRRWSLDYAADLASAAFDDHRWNVCDPSRLNGRDRFTELIIYADELDLNLVIPGRAQSFDQSRNVILAVRAPGAECECHYCVLVARFDLLDRPGVRLIVLHHCAPNRNSFPELLHAHVAGCSGMRSNQYRLSLGYKEVEWPVNAGELTNNLHP